jgi:hypothetical protein
MAHRKRPQDNTHERSPAELEEHLRRQVHFLRSSAAAVDVGNLDEAVRLASVVRVLCHDGTGSPALLQQLHLRKRLGFVDTALNLPQLPRGSFVFDFGLATMRTDFDRRTVQPCAHLDDLPPERINPPARFGHWWRTPFLSNRAAQLIRNRPGFTYSRSNVVLGLAQHDGGAHVDRAIPADHEAFLDNDGGVQFRIQGAPVIIGRYALGAAWMRQIAHELERTLEQDPRTAAILDG